MIMVWYDNSAIIGELHAVGSTRISVTGSIAYTAQTPWIRNATLRDNILFGKPYEHTRYQQVSTHSNHYIVYETNITRVT
jgi:ABC-type transport system involved in cytochrome bd biosynthesis fused ATPase/permease subunit